MFRSLLMEDLKAVFEMNEVRLCAIDDETECIYFNPEEVVSTPIVGSGKNHFRVYGTLGINQDEANGAFGFIHHKLLCSRIESAKRFQIQGDERTVAQDLYDQHRILSSVPCVWEADIDWNNAPEIKGGSVRFEEGDFVVDKVDDYLFEANISTDQLDEMYALDYFDKHFHNSQESDSLKLGGCSSVKSGDIYGRNYDWTYDNNATVVVRTTGLHGKHSSIGVAASMINASELGMMVWHDKMKLIPYLLTDGVNDCGVFCNINVVPSGDKGITSGTHSELPYKAIPVTAIPRIVLDSFATAKDAIDWIVNDANIYGLHNESTNQECHLMVGDKEGVYVVEFVDNKAVVIDISDKPFITNFYMAGVSFDANGHVEPSTVTPYGTGLERYNILADAYDSATDVGSMQYLLKQLKYTNAYNFDDPARIWKTDFAAPYADAGSQVFPNLTAQDSLTKYTDSGIFEYVAELFANRDRVSGQTWQTVSSSVYNMEDKVLFLTVQENDQKYHTFPLNK